MEQIDRLIRQEEELEENRHKVEEDDTYELDDDELQEEFSRG